METERGHVSVRRGMSWSLAGGRKPFQSGDTETINRETDASWERRDDRGVKGQMTSASTNQQAWKTSLTRSASLSETELKEARERSQIIATQLTIPSGGSSSRGVQLFNRRRQRVNAFTLDSCGGGAGKDEEAEHADTRNNNLTWREGRRDDSEIHRETDKVLNVKNKYRTKPLPWSPPSGGSIESEVAGSDIMKDPGDEHIYEEVDVAQHRHFHPVKESEEDDRVRDEEREREEIYDDAESAVKDGISPVNENHNCTLREEGGPTGWTYTELTTPTETQNGFHITQCTMGKIQNGGAVSVSQSGLNPTIVNRTARPFFSPSTVQATAAERTSIPPAPCYPTPTLPTAPSYSSPPFQTFSPAPPPPSYPTPPLPVFPNHPLSPIDPVSSPNPVTSARATHVSQHPPPPTCPKPITFIPYTPQPVGQQFQQEPIKTGILEEGAAAIRRSSTARKSMFTFKEKPIVTPNPELLSLVQGNDERKKYGLRSISDQPLDEELLALGAEASNFLAAEEVRAEAAKVPEWSSCLKSSRTREPRGQHQPEQTLTNVSGKGAELFAKRQSRMEKYVVENKNAPGSGAHMRSLSPTSSLPPSWIYPSNMPGRVKAIVNNTDLNAQLARPLQTVQQVKRRPSQQAPAPAPVPEEPPLENGCTKIEMDLSRHRPYQLNPSLFIFNPVKDPTSTLPRGAPPPPRPLVTAGSFSSLPSNNYNSLPHCRPSQSTPSQSTTRGVGGGDYYPPQHRGTTGPSEPRITSPLSGFSEEKVGSPRPGTQAPCPTFSAKRAGIEAQTTKESPPTPTPTRTPQFSRRFCSPEGAPSAGLWSPSPPANQTYVESSRSPDPATSTAPSPFTPAWETRCQSPAVVNQTTKPFSPVSSPRPKPCSPVSPWGSRCQSPNTNQTTRPFSTAALSHSSASRPSHPGTITSSLSPSPLSPPWGSRPPSASSSPSDSKANHRLLAKNIINAAKRKNSPSPGTLSGHGLPISPLGGSATAQHHQSSKPPFSPYQPRGMGCRSPSFASPPPTPTGMIRSPVRLYNTRSLTDSDASVESEDSGLRSPGLHRSHNTCPRGWGGSLRIKRGSIGTDL